MDEPRSAAATRTSPALDVTALPPVGELLEGLTDQLAAWMPAQRWYAHKGAGTPQVSVAGWAALRVTGDHVVLLTAIRAELPGDRSALYQLPLVLRRPPAGGEAAVLAGDEGAEIGVLAVPGGPLRVDDATRDPEGRTALVLALVAGVGALGSELSMTVSRTPLTAPLPVGEGMRTRVLRGEQSNTSMIVEADGAPPMIVKLFRVLQDGENPDVVLQGALTAAGSTRVPPVIGSATVRVGGVRTHGLCAQEFLPGVEDAWRTALGLAAAGEDFTAAARALGATVAEVHRDLAAAFGTVAVDERLRAEMVDRLRERLEQISAEVPQVAEHRPALETLLDAAAGVTWPAMQRIHGDLHLGQVLLAPGRGWVLLDFEGEPLRPLADRSGPDSPLRDVAGMLRSLDYVAGAVEQDQGIDATAWARDSRDAFLAGYVETMLSGAEELPERDAAREAASFQALLAAFEADKAVYEALYEARNRPGWLGIPLAALERISQRSAPVEPQR